MVSSSSSPRKEDGSSASYGRSSHGDHRAADFAFFDRASAMLSRGLFVPAAEGALPSWRLDEFELLDAAQAELKGPKTKAKTRQVGGGAKMRKVICAPACMHAWTLWWGRPCGTRP